MANGHGGKRRGAGRRKGIPNLSTASLMELARDFGADGIHQLAIIAGLVEGQKGSDNDMVRIQAMRAILDRGYGRPTQALVGDEDEPPVRVSRKIEMVVVDPMESHRHE